MDTTKTNVTKVCGVIMIVCASAVAVLNLSLSKNTDSYIMSFILLIPGILFLVRKQSAESRQMAISLKKRKIIITTLSVSLVAGIATLIITLF